MGGEFISNDPMWWDTFLENLPYLLMLGALLGWAKFLSSHLSTVALTCLPEVK